MSEEEKKTNEATLAELKNTLPVHFPDREDQTFTFKTWTMKEEKQIAKMKTDLGVMGKFVSGVLCHMLDKFCGEDFQGKTKEEKMVMVNQLDIPNVMHMWVWLRYDSMGDKIVMDVQCPGCGRMNKKSLFSLDGMDITLKGKEDPKVIDYKVRRPFDFNGEKIETIKIKVTKWHAMESAKDEVAGNEGLMKETIFRNSICGMNDSEGFIDVNAMTENLQKVDIESLSEAVSKHNGGPSLSIASKCRYCGRDYYRHLNWSYDHFFAHSSLPEN